MQINIDVRDLVRFADAWRHAPEIVTEELEASMYLSTGMLHREIVDTTPVGASGGSAAGLSGSISYHIDRSAGEVSGTVGTANPYAVAVEMGTKPHFPPIAPIQDWVEARLGIGDDKSRNVAFLIARKISKEGTKGQHMFANAKERLTPDVVREFEDAVKRIAKRLGDLA